MFLHSNTTMELSEDTSVKFRIQNEEMKLDVLKINQFESKFQNMSVVVYDHKLNKYFAFIKGAPEQIQRNSILKVDEYDKLL